MGSKKDVKKYPCYKYEGGQLIQIIPPSNWNIWELQAHHYIEQQFMKKNPKKYKEIEYLQKIIFLSPEMHADLTNRHSNFFGKWGIELKELVYGV